MSNFWESRDRLAAILQHARSRRVSPWAVLGGVLARVVAATPPEVQLPPIVGGHASLNLFVGIVGRSGGGKGASQAAAASLIELSEGALFSELTVGTGEGIAAAFVERIKGEDGSMEIYQHSESALFDVAEVDTLAALAARSGATLLSELRKVWSGERLGFQNRDRARTLPVDAHRYRASLIAGIQPRRAGALLDDADGGTPQRFIWLSTEDPHAPDTAPEPPAHIEWIMPSLEKLPMVDGRRTMQVCDAAWDAIEQAQVSRLRGDGHALDGHALLARLKVAAAFALLDERGDVTGADWALAGLLMKESDRVRQSCREAMSEAARDVNLARAEARAEANVVTADHAEIAALNRCKDRILANLGTSWSAAGSTRSNLSARLRDYFDNAVTELYKEDLIEVENGEYQGQPRTRLKLRTPPALAEPPTLHVMAEKPRNHADLSRGTTGVAEPPTLTENRHASTSNHGSVNSDPGYCVHGVTTGKRCSKCGGVAVK